VYREFTTDAGAQARPAKFEQGICAKQFAAPAPPNLRAKRLAIGFAPSSLLSMGAADARCVSNSIEVSRLELSNFFKFLAISPFGLTVAQ
jgi:hypothetical protein